MPLPLTWDQMPLTAPQQAIMQQLAAWDGNGVPPINYQQSKQAQQWLNSLATLTNPTLDGMARTRNYYQSQAATDYDAAHP